MAEPITIEAKIDSVLTGDAKANALGFVAFLRANDFQIGLGEGDGWAIGGVLGDSLGYLLVNGKEDFPGPWTFWFNTCEFGDGPADDDLKECAWEHASICGHFSSGGKQCGCGDQPGFTRAIFGKVFENRCHSPLMFFNPDAKTLVYIKKLMLMLKQTSAA